jgi:hypothetical protein
VKLGVILLVKLNGAYWRQRRTTGAFALCTKRMMKLTPGYYEESGEIEYTNYISGSQTLVVRYLKNRVKKLAIHFVFYVTQL